MTYYVSRELSLARRIPMAPRWLSHDQQWSTCTLWRPSLPSLRLLWTRCIDAATPPPLLLLLPHIQLQGLLCWLPRARRIPAQQLQSFLRRSPAIRSLKLN